MPRTATQSVGLARAIRRLGGSDRPARGRRDKRALIYATMAGLLVAYLALLIVRRSGSHSTGIDGWGVDGFELLAGAMCVVGGRRRRPGSAVPLVLGGAIVAWGLGDLVLTIESLGGGVPASPSAADALYLSFFPLSYVAVVLLIRGETRRLSSPSWLDGAVAGLGAGAVCAAFAFSAITHTAHESGLATAVDLAYPVGDVLLLLLVVGGTAVMSGRRKAPWLMLATGFSINVFGDTANLFSASLGATHLGMILNAVAWPISSLLIAISISISPGLADPLASQKPPGFLLPGLAAGAGLAILLVGAVGHINLVAIGLATLTLLGSWCAPGSRCGTCAPRRGCDRIRRSPTT